MGNSYEYTFALSNGVHDISVKNNNENIHQLVARYSGGKPTAGTISIYAFPTGAAKYVDIHNAQGLDITDIPVVIRFGGTIGKLQVLCDNIVGGNSIRITDIGSSGVPLNWYGENILEKDTETGALKTVSNANCQIHAGNHYFYRNWANVSGADTEVDFMFTTPNSLKIMHAQAIIRAQEEFNLQIFEDVTTSDDGTPLTGRNCNRSYPDTPEMSLFNAPTITDTGTSIWRAKVNPDVSPVCVSLGENYEIDVKVDTKYLWRLTKVNADTHWIDFDFFWYELAPLS